MISHSLPKVNVMLTHTVKPEAIKRRNRAQTLAVINTRANTVAGVKVEGKFLEGLAFVRRWRASPDGMAACDRRAGTSAWSRLGRFAVTFKITAIVNQ